MANQDWYPIKLADRIAWHSNFSAQAALSGTTHGLVAAQVTQIAADASVVSLVIKYMESVSAFSQAATQWKDLVLEGPLGSAMPTAPSAPDPGAVPVGGAAAIEARTRQYAALIKASVGYTAEIGEAYGLIAPASPSPSYETPSFTAKAESASHVSLSIAKSGYSVLAVDCRRGSGDWEQIGVSMTATYVDARPPLVAGQPETREYRVQGMVKNERVGATSPIISVVTIP